MRGTVEWFSPQKGYGFIKGPNGEEYFAHHSQIQGQGYQNLYEGEQVDFDPVSGPKGLAAHRIRKL